MMKPSGQDNTETAGLGGWVYELHVDSYDKLNAMTKDLPKRAQQFNFPFFYNRYATEPSSGGPFSLRMGFYSKNRSPEAVKSMKDKIDKLLDYAEREYGTKKVMGQPDFRVVEGVIVDEVKMLTTSIATCNFNNEKQPKPVMYLVIHHLMNQLGYSYDDEIEIYSKLIENIYKQHGQKATITLENISEKPQ